MRLASRTGCLLLALVWLLPGFGLIDLTVTWDPEWPVVLEAGWGMFVSTGIALPLLVAGVRPRAAGSALVLLLVAAGALLVGAVAGLEPETWWMFALLAVSVVPVRWLTGAVSREDRRTEWQLPLLVLGVVAAPWCLGYAWRMADYNRLDASHGDITNGVDHYSVQAATALLVAAATLVAGRHPRHARLLGTAAGSTAFYLGLVSLNFPGQPGGFGGLASASALVWGVLVVGLVWWPLPATSPARPRWGRLGFGRHDDRQA